jgi:hypothetical protein
MGWACFTLLTSQQCFSRLLSVLLCVILSVALSALPSVVPACVAKPAPGSSCLDSYLRSEPIVGIQRALVAVRSFCYGILPGNFSVRTQGCSHWGDLGSRAYCSREHVHHATRGNFDWRRIVVRVLLKKSSKEMYVKPNQIRRIFV